MGKHYYVCKPHVELGMKGTIIIQSAATAFPENQFRPDISIYQNPATDITNVKVRSNILGKTFNIADLTGRQVFNGKLSAEITSVDISHLENTFYLFQVGEQKKQTFKFIKN